MVMNKKTLIKGYILVVLSALLFGCMPLITRYIYNDGLNRESVVLMRNLLALPLLAALTWGQEKSFRIPVKALPSVVVLALLAAGFKNIRLGPTLPAFLSPAVAEMLTNSFGLRPIGEINSDIHAMMKGK